MQHLTEFGISKHDVPLLIDPKLCCGTQWQRDGDRHGHSYEDFCKFPERHGWYLTDEKELKLMTNWKPNTFAPYKPLKKGELLQAWLFFGLLECIVQGKKPLFSKKIGDSVSPPGSAEWKGNPRANPQPLLSVDLLTEGRGTNRYVNTQHLPKALEKWYSWERKHPESSKLRLIRADLALEMARQTVLANLVKQQKEPLAEKAGRPTSSGSDSETQIQTGQMAVQDTQRQKQESIDKAGDIESEIPSEVALSLMILGETLSAAKTHIMEDLGAQIRGWHKDDDGGWGPPAYVMEKMKEARWCPRSQRILKEQLGSNATLLLAALEHHEGSQEHGRLCNEEKCMRIAGVNDDITSEDRDTVGITQYLPAHHFNCNGCDKLGPNMGEVYDALRQVDDSNVGEQFPLFRIEFVRRGTLQVITGVKVDRWRRKPRNKTRKPPFVTISHVWAQGLGNETENKVHKCQLDFILRLLDKDELKMKEDGEDGESHRFWLDTFAIPVRPRSIGEDGSTAPSSSPRTAEQQVPDFDKLKRRSIRQIYHVFSEASHAIVVDKDLCRQKAGPTPSQVSLKILTSAWMRRLWTLQESFLSRQIWFPFVHPQLYSFDEIFDAAEDRDDRENANPILTLSMANIAKKRLLHNLMGEERATRNQNTEQLEARGSMLVASAWRAVRWRTTSRLTDETLALATLLNLDYRETRIGNAGGLEKGTSGERTEREDALMMDFWKLVHKTYEGSIPAGMIFLPGPKLSEPGFGWAPRTWMACQDEEHPNPLNLGHAPTQLHEEGLLVQYPGFLVHCLNATLLLTPDHRPGQESRSFEFPVDRELLEWYRVTALSPTSSGTFTSKILDEHRNRPIQFAVIISRPRPRERPSEIGILVQVYRMLPRWKHTDPVKKQIYCCRVIHRVRVCRVKQPKDFKPPNYNLEEDQPLGEVVDQDQHWYVDGYESSLKRDSELRTKDRSPEVSETSIPPTTSSGTDSALGTNDKGDIHSPQDDNPRSVGELWLSAMREVKAFTSKILPSTNTDDVAPPGHRLKPSESEAVASSSRQEQQIPQVSSSKTFPSTKSPAMD